MNPPIVLVINADDFGQSPAVNEGILAAHRDGIVTSTSLMVRWPAAAEAAAAAAEFPALSIGLHLDLGEWSHDNGEWRALYQVVDGHDEQLVQQEIQSQLEQFRAMVGREPTHLDSHQHVHRREPAQALLRAAGEALGIPVRHFSPYTYVGDFYGQSDDGSPVPDALTEEHLLKIVSRLTAGHWELACHPAAGPTPSSMYSNERLLELAILTSPRVAAAVSQLGISLLPFPIRPKS
ncbi:MAG TPA: ChbG/HpnK family deacetylase [Vicinamibacterales bacterium]|nr:ChbG/HpnK family deacetylase [Vicinamibacterales bacterium]